MFIVGKNDFDNFGDFAGTYLRKYGTRKHKKIMPTFLAYHNAESSQKLELLVIEKARDVLNTNQPTMHE